MFRTSPARLVVRAEVLELWYFAAWLKWWRNKGSKDSPGAEWLCTGSVGWSAGISEEHLLLSTHQGFLLMVSLMVSVKVEQQFLPLNCSERPWKFYRDPPFKSFCVSSAALEHLCLSQVNILYIYFLCIYIYIHFLSLVSPATPKHVELFCPPACNWVLPRFASVHSQPQALEWTRSVLLWQERKQRRAATQYL